jgi:hypothetical protein
MIAQLLAVKQQGLSQPTNAFDFCVIELREHRNLLSIVSNRDEEAGSQSTSFLFCVCF